MIRIRPGGGDVLKYADYEGHIRPNVIKRGDDSYVAMWRVEGLPFETLEDDLLYARRNDVNTLLINIASERLVIAAHEVRTLAEDNIIPDGEFVTEFGQSFHEVLRERLTRGSAPLYSIEQFLSLTVRPHAPMGRTVAGFLRSAQLQEDESEEDAIKFLEDRAAMIAAGLKAYGLRRLGYRETHEGLFSEPGEAMVLIHSGRRTPVPVPDGPLGDALYVERTHWGPGRTITIDQADGRQRYASVFGFKVPGHPCRPWVFNHLKSSALEYSFSRHFHYMPMAKGEATTKKKIRRLEITKDPGLDQAAALQALRGRLMSRRSMMGNHHNVLTIFADSEAGLELAAPEAQAQLARNNASVVREDWADLPAYWSHLPGNVHLWPRPMPVTSDNWASMASFNAYPVGPEKGRWGPPAIIFRSAGGTAVRHHWHRRDVGNFAWFGPTGGGKAQPLDAKVLTPGGWVEIGSLRVGDIITTPSGQNAPITGVFPQGKKQIYRVTFVDGRSAECCDDHLWKVWKWDNRREIGKTHKTRRTVNKGAEWAVAPLSDIRSGKGIWKRAAIPLVEPYAIELPAQDLPIPPYVLGVLLGDGNLTGMTAHHSPVRLASADADVLARVTEEMPDFELVPAGGVDYRLRQRVPVNLPYRGRRSSIRRALDGLGLSDKYSHEKSVPACYKKGSVAQRLALMQGLLDSDGSIARAYITFSSTSYQLAKDVQEIAWSLGAIAIIRTRQTRFTYKGVKKSGRPSWRVSIIHPEISAMVSLPRKVDSCKSKSMRHRLTISSVELVGEKPAVCIAVDHPSHLYITNDFIVTHNTAGVLALLAQSERYDPRPQIVYFDQYRGADIGLRALGGADNYHVYQDGLETGCAPLKALDPSLPRDMACLRYIARGLIGGQIDREEQRAIALALNMVMEMPVADRSWGEVRAMLGYERGGIGERLEPWCRGNEYGWALDCQEDRLSFASRVSGHDTTGIVSNEAVLGPIQGYLAYRTESILDGRRAIIIIDEFHHWIENPFWAKRAASLARTIRRRNGILGMLTQHPADIAKSSFGHTLMQQTPQQFFAPDPRAKPEDYVGGAQVTEIMFNKIKRGMKSGAGLHLRVVDGEAMVVQLPLSGLDAHLAVLSSRDTAVALAGEIRQQSGKEWVNEFMRRHEEAAV